MNVRTYRIPLLATALLCLAGAAHAEVPVRGFSDVGFHYVKTDTGSSNSFTQGGLDLFLAGSLSPKVSFLTETSFELGQDNHAGLDIERLLIQYYFSPWFKVGAGRFHTALGYWNDTFHHGAWLQTTIGRPLMYHFEDDDGLLPMHTMGIEVRGEGDMGPGKLGYLFNVGNGRGPKVDPPQIMNDKDQHKAVNLNLYYTLPQLGNLRFGGTYYADTLPGDNRNNTGFVEVQGSEAIYGGHIVWQPGDFELLAEGLQIKHTYTSGEVNDGLWANYLQLSYKLNDYTPYYRYDLIVPENGIDQYTQVEGRRAQHTFGVRYDVTANSALKGEYSNLNQAGDTTHTVAANWSFTF